MFVYKYNCRLFQCSIRLSIEEAKDKDLLHHIEKVLEKFGGKINSQDPNEISYQFQSEPDMFSFGRFVYDRTFDPITYQPNWIVKSPNLPDSEFKDKHSALEEYESRVELDIQTKIFAPSISPVLS